MTKKWVLMMTVVLAMALLAACGNADETHDAAHHEHHQPDEGSHPGGHAGHEHSKGADQDLYKASFTFDSGTAQANVETGLTIQITDQEGRPLHDYEVSHEKLLHLIIVKRDLSYFSHIHPDYNGEGKFTINTTFPEGGDYKIFADFVPKGGSSATLSGWVTAAGDLTGEKPAAADSSLTKLWEGKEIELRISGTTAGENVTLTFDIRDATTKQGIVNLEPYLGAIGHVVILSADAEQYIHVHPLDEQATGPKASFATSFPASGAYKIWGQFQHQGEVFTVSFVVDIK